MALLAAWMILAYPKVRVLSWIFLAVGLLQAGLAVVECRDKMTEAVEDDIRCATFLGQFSEKLLTSFERVSFGSSRALGIRRKPDRPDNHPDDAGGPIVRHADIVTRGNATFIPFSWTGVLACTLFGAIPAGRWPRTVGLRGPDPHPVVLV